MKRPCEDSSSAESELEEPIDVGSESIYFGHMKASFLRCGSPTTTTQVMARKKRRGIIEKRRRDRINNSLLELRRLVPTAFEKQSSAKLEKAEILQMTVDHLKMLQATGGKGCFDAHALALDFLSLGFRECLSEVCRYLGAVEGPDSGDPLRSRLLSHLVSCASQRDAAAAALTVAPPHHVHLQPPPPPPPQHPALPHPLHPHHWAAAVAALRPSPYGALLDAGGEAGAPHRSLVTSSSLADSASSSPSSSSSSSTSSSSSLVLPCPPTPLSASLLPFSTSFPFALHGGFPVLHPSTSTSSSSSSTSPQTPHSGSRPYRPWGTEVGAF